MNDDYESVPSELRSVPDVDRTVCAEFKRRRTTRANRGEESGRRL